MNVLHVRYDDPKAPELFARSLRQTGFAVVTNHPIAPELVSSAYGEWERFFASGEKLAHRFDPARQAGYFPFRTEKAKGYAVSDLKEFYHYYPQRIRLPEMAAVHTPALYAQLSQLGAELLGWLEDYTPEHIRCAFSMPLRRMIQNSEETLLRPIHYPPLSGAEEKDAIRAAEHEDINLITLLPAATAPGLQVKDTEGRWHEVSCNPGELVINAGDMLQMVTQGYFSSTPHRVMNPTGAGAASSRYSMPLFLHPAPDVRLSKTHTARTYLRERLAEIGLL
ncbi:MAG: isopenicillin N synthase family oxygenase [Deltaproteobacteria bacterium]|nr:isopenicillin N synthase family oxygenase [Deltaproteobacteria bacterium]